MSNHNQSSIPKRTILYYPTISIPTSDWLRRSLLYWDEIGSIVPIDYEEKTLIPYSPDIQFLKTEGEFRPFRPGELDSSRQVMDDFERELIDIIESPKFQTLLAPQGKEILHSRIHREKVFHSVEDYLLHRGLARRDEEDWDWLKFENRTALLYMALLAKYLADIDSMSTVPGTDLQEYENLIFEARSPSDGFASLTINFLNVVPVPREDVSLADILEFKRKRQLELLEFRQQLNEFYKSLRKCEKKADAHDIAATFGEKIRKELDKLQAVLDDSRLATIAGSLKTIIKLDFPKLLALAGLAVGQAIPVANVLVPVSLIGLGATGSIEVTSFLTDKRNEQRAKLRESPFAYLYHAKRERIIK